MAIRILGGLKSSRRQLLKRVISTGASLPFLSYLPSLGAQETARKRFITMFSPNGTIPDQHFPSGSEHDFQLKRILEPLQAIREDLLIFKGLENKIGKPGDGHQRGMGGLWTAAHLTEGETQSGGCTTCDPVDWAGGPSIDQVVANAISHDLRFKSLEYGFRCGKPDVWKRMCYTARNAPLEPEINPLNAFDRLYLNFVTPSADQQCDMDTNRNFRLRHSLDAAVDDFKNARRHLSVEDREKLELHAESVRSILRIIEPQSGECPQGCAVPEKSEQININNYGNMVQLGKTFMDLMVSAFACNLTAVASMQWTVSVGTANYPHLGIAGNHHSMSHVDDSDLEVKAQLTEINRWYATQFLYLVNKLKSTPDPAGNGSLFDNSFVIWGNELGKGNTHTRKDLPFVSAGDAQGYFRTGRYIEQNSQVNHSRLLTSIANAFGVETHGFGDYEEGPLANLI